MEYDRMLEELFREEDRAREMADKLMHVAKSSKRAAAAERDSLLAFLRGPLERHMAYEERAIFPQLERHGLGAEVQVATKQHVEIRKAAQDLAAVSGEGSDELATLIFETARLLMHHTNFEGDYIYPELTHEEWRDLMKESVVAERASQNPA